MPAAERFEPSLSSSPRRTPDAVEANSRAPSALRPSNSLKDVKAPKPFAIGPSYFMTKDGSAPDLDRVWRRAIRPLLEEHFFGSGRDVEAELGVTALRKNLAEAADSTTPEPNDDDDSAS